MNDRNTQNELVLIYSQVVSKRSNLPDGTASEAQVGEIDALIDRAASVRKEDLNEFKFREHDVWGPSAQVRRLDGVPHVALNTHVERIDSFLGYLRGTLPADTVDRIGYNRQ